MLNKTTDECSTYRSFYIGKEKVPTDSEESVGRKVSNIILTRVCLAYKNYNKLFVIKIGKRIINKKFPIR